VKRALPDYFARHNLIALALLILAAASVAQTNKAKAPPPTHSFARKLKLQGVTDFAEVTPDLYGGAQPSHDGLVALTKMGIDVVVDLRGTRRKDEERDVHSLGMKYLSIFPGIVLFRGTTYSRASESDQGESGKEGFRPLPAGR